MAIQKDNTDVFLFRPFDFPDFQSSYQDNNEDVIIEALGAEIELYVSLFFNHILNP